MSGAIKAPARHESGDDRKHQHRPFGRRLQICPINGSPKPANRYANVFITPVPFPRDARPSKIGT